MASGWKSSRTLLEGEWTPLSTLPDLSGQTPEEPPADQQGESARLVAPARAAISKALEHDWWKLASPQYDQSNFQRWAVPSRTTPGEFYLVWRKHQHPGHWYEVLDCNCKAIASGKYLVCWHKAAVFIRQRRWGVQPQE